MIKGYTERYPNSGKNVGKMAAVVLLFFFSLSSVAYGAPIVSVTSPKGGEVWRRGTMKTIKWKYKKDLGGFVKIDLYKDGSFFQTITESTPIGENGSGTFVWEIPYSLPPAKGYKIKVTSVSNSEFSVMSKKEFTVGEQKLASTRVDLLPFFCPPCVGQGNGQRNIMSNSECFYTHTATVKGKSGFYIVKSCNDPHYFEEFNYDGSYIYHLADTTWATYEGGRWTDVRCYDGRIAYSSYLNESGIEGGKWVPRYMGPGEQSPALPVTIAAYAKESCSRCNAPYTGSTARWVKLVSHGTVDIGSGLGVHEVIRVAIMDGPGKGENFWYAKDIGWIGFGHVDPPDGPKNLSDVTHIVRRDSGGQRMQSTCGQTPPPVNLPDVTVTNLTWTPSNPQPGQQVQFIARVKNQGTSGTGQIVGVGFFVDEGQGYRQVGWHTKPAMDAGAELDFPMDQRWNVPQSGTFKILAVADDVNRFGESNEQNNGLEKVLTVNAPAIPDDHWKGEYFNNMNLTAPAVLVRDDGTGFINFDWGTGSPAQGAVGCDNFSIRWTRKVNFEGGTYRFMLTADDGVRLWIDGELKLDKWIDQAPTTYAVEPVFLSAGLHTLVMEYYEHGGGAVAKLSWERLVPSIPDDHWKGEYFNNLNLTGSAVLVRDDGSGFLNFDWGGNSPGSGVNPDNFSVRWTRRVNFIGGTYKFTITADDGVKFWIDEKLMLDRWIDQPATTYTVEPVVIASGVHTLRMEFYEKGGAAVAKLFWETITPSIPDDHWKGEYFNNLNLMAPAVVVRDDGNAFLDFDWGGGSPASGIVGADNFSVRWTRTVNFDPGTYVFTVTADDGIRLWIDGDLKLNKWVDQPPTTFAVGPIYLAGSTKIRVEYYEHGGGAVAKVSWQLHQERVVFRTGWEEGERTGLENQLAFPSRQVVEAYCERVAGVGRNGGTALKIQGISQATAHDPYAYSYHKIFDVDIPIERNMKIGYWIYRVYGSMKIAVDGDLQNADGSSSTIRDFGGRALKDQWGFPVHPAHRQNNTRERWYYVEVDLSPAAGSRLKSIMLAFDNGSNGFNGPYLSYIDDLKIFVSQYSSARWSYPVGNGFSVRDGWSQSDPPDTWYRTMHLGEDYERFRGHLGEDYAKAGDSLNLPVYAAAPGKVLLVIRDPACGSYVNPVIVEHYVDGQTFYTFYGHIVAEADLQEGSWIQKRQRIGTAADVSSFGFAPHLHFMIMNRTALEQGPKLCPGQTPYQGWYYINAGYSGISGEYHGTEYYDPTDGIAGNRFYNPAQFIEGRMW